MVDSVSARAWKKIYPVFQLSAFLASRYIEGHVIVRVQARRMYGKYAPLNHPLATSTNIMYAVALSGRGPCYAYVALGIQERH